MSEFRRQVLLTVVTAVMSALILTPMFFAIKLLLDTGLGILLGAVVTVGLLVAYLLRRETAG